MHTDNTHREVWSDYFALRRIAASGRQEAVMNDR